MSGQIVGVGTFIHVVKDLDQTMRFYGTGLGLETRNPGAAPGFSANALVESLYDAKGSQSRVAVFKVPGSPLGLEFVQFKDVLQKVVRREVKGPGASVLVLSVPDMQATMARLKENGATVISSTTVADPDGFFVELKQSNEAGAMLLLTVDKLDTTLHLFHDLLGFQPATPPALVVNQASALDVVAAAAEGRLKRSVAKVPGADFEVEFREFGGGVRPAPAAIHDPGSGVLRLMTTDVDGLLEKLKAVGVPVASAGGEAASLNGRHFVILRDPDNFFFQLVPGPAALAK